MQFNIHYAFQIILQGLFMIALLHNEICGYACQIPFLANGRVRTRARSRLIRFQCYAGFEMVGHRYAMCTRGGWDVPLPVCIKSGCSKLQELTNGQLYFTNENAAVMFICKQGYVLNGPSEMYCNGTHWNGTLPTCSDRNPTKLSTSCDFEKDDLCGWIHDPIHDFDWSRENRKTPNGHMGTGPSYDHTLGPDKDGYYMYIESMSRKENDTARLLSQLYPPELSKRGCFSFYYHMYGKTTGSLRIYQRPENVDFYTIVTDTYLQQKYVLFNKSGNQGNYWYTGFFDLNEVNENFQIIIEGVRGPGYVSDIAIDDISLLQNEKCVERMKEHSEATAVPVTIIDSCLNRCNTTIKSEAIECQCDIDCLDSMTCCSDYNDLCVFQLDFTGTAVYNTDYMTTTNSFDESSIASMLPTSLIITATNTTFIPSQTEEIHVKLETTTPSTTTTAISTTTMTTSTTTSTTPRITTVIKLIFDTPSPPMINATGLFNITNDKSFETTTKSKEIITSVTKTTKLPITTKTAVEDIKTTIEEEEQTTKIERNFNKKIEYTQDAHENETPINNHGSKATSPLLIIVISIVIIIVIISSIIILVSKHYKNNRLSGSYIFEKTMFRFRNSVRRSPNNADMKFLVQEEELEHDYLE